jgi:hypothetical protein
MKNEMLLPLVTKLKQCPTHNSTVSRELFIEAWDQLVREDVTPFTKPTLPVMAALLLHDEVFAGLLHEAENLQLAALVQLAQDRFEQQTNPTNKLGRLIAGSLKKET